MILDFILMHMPFRQVFFLFQGLVTSLNEQDILQILKTKEPMCSKNN